MMGRKGFVKELKEYWDVATYFEMAVLESLHGHSAAYDTAVVAASRMYFFNSPSWHLRSTLKNIRLIRCRYPQGAMFKFGGLFRILESFLSSKINI